MVACRCKTYRCETCGAPAAYGRLMGLELACFPCGGRLQVGHSAETAPSQASGQNAGGDSAAIPAAP